MMNNPNVLIKKEQKKSMTIFSINFSRCLQTYSWQKDKTILQTNSVSLSRISKGNLWTYPFNRILNNFWISFSTKFKPPWNKLLSNILLKMFLEEKSVIKLNAQTVKLSMNDYKLFIHSLSKSKALRASTSLLKSLFMEKLFQTISVMPAKRRQMLLKVLS